MSDVYVWRIYCPLEMQYVAVISATQPTVCPNDSTPVDPNITCIMESRFANLISDGYVNVESQLADNQALKLQASDTNGGIIMNAGVGGITVNSDNTIALNAAAASHFTTTMGNITVESTVGLVNIDAGSGLNLGNDSITTPIDIGTTSFAKDINICNNTGASSLVLRAGTGKLTLNSADTTSDAITIFSSGGINTDATGLINITSGDNTVSAITLDSTFNGGGVVLASGAQGIILTSNGGPIALGSWSGGDVYIGTAAVARTLYIGNTTSTTALNLSSGTGGISIGNDSSAGEIQLGNFASAKTVIIGNSTSGSRLFSRFGTAGLVRHQEAHTSLSDADATLTIADMLKIIFTITPTVDRTLTLPTAANAVAGISGLEVGDSIEITIINESSAVNEAVVIMAAGTGGSIEGNPNIAPRTNNAGTFMTSGSGTLRIRFTNVSSGTEAYVAYRTA